MPEKHEAYHAISLNKPLSELQRRLTRFNIFQATGMAEREIKHTQFLGYLLDPNESHGLKDDFLCRFIQAANANNANLMPLADLNLSYARIYKEKRIRHNGQNNQIDLLLEIPSLTDPEKYHIVAIENKIRALQGQGQLEAYRTAIEESYRTGATADRAFFFLTVYGEQPLDPCWTSITYSEIVLPAIEGILKDSRETISSYMSYVLEDYIDFIRGREEQDPENDLDSLIGSIPPDILETARELGRADPASFGLGSAVAIRYSKAIQYIKNYRRDPRTRLLNYFNGEECQNLLKDNGFTAEHSIRSHLRFSFLDNGTAEQLRRYCANPTKKWLNSLRHLAVELVLQKDGTNVHCDVILTLGPTGIEHTDKRTALVERLRTAADYQQNRTTTDHFTKITPHEFSELRTQIPEDNGIETIKSIISDLQKKHNKRIKEINKALSEFLINLPNT